MTWLLEITDDRDQPYTPPRFWAGGVSPDFKVPLASVTPAKYPTPEAALMALADWEAAPLSRRLRVVQERPQRLGPSLT